MYAKILIANRGEIAARVIRTCRKMNIETIAIYSEADAELPYVSLADEAYCVGPPQVNESYLQMDTIIEIAKKHGAEAIHPGYGFMSENSTFVQKCEENGIDFIGPSHQVMEQMGNKIIARKMMETAQVPIVPGSKLIKDVEMAKQVAKTIGYPIIVKAAAGGGGIGMQVVEHEEQLADAFTNNQKRAASFFGSGDMFIEKYIAFGRHIEIQVIADKHGNAFHLYERECSIQRRNQKVIEETPAPTLSEETKNAMCDAAIRAVKQLQYYNAGTIEFLVDDKENFYFLEMNTRIQVEHAITEEVTSIDLIEKQLEIAYGLPLEWIQSNLKTNGHAIEARIYAEDPVRFFPSPGTITHYKEPVSEHIRMESTVTSGTKVTPFYDPMISKVIVHGENRKQAIQRLIDALEQYEIEGIKTNIPMLLETLQHEAFQAGETYTNFVHKQLQK